MNDFGTVKFTQMAHDKTLVECNLVCDDTVKTESKSQRVRSMYDDDSETSDVSSFWSELNALDKLHNMTGYELLLYNMNGINFHTKNNGKIKKGIKKNRGKKWHYNK